MKRVWVNQPSTLQRLHKYHGMNVLVDTKKERIYFLSGALVSMDIQMSCLEVGWR